MRSREAALGVCISLSVISAIILFLRLFSRWRICKRVGWDDYLITIAVAFSYVHTVPLIIAALSGLGEHIEVVHSNPNYSFTKIHLSIWIAQIALILSLCFVKFSILLFYTSLGSVWLRRISFFTLSVIGVQSLAYLIAHICKCLPVEAFWERDVEDAKCVDTDALYSATIYTNLITDVIVYVLPINLVWNIVLPTKQKWGLAAVLCLGLLACVASAIRISERPDLELIERDITWAVAPTTYWAEVEVNFAIIAASIPSLKPLAKHCISRKSSNALGRTHSRTKHRRQLSPVTLLMHANSVNSNKSNNSRLKSDATVIAELEKGTYFAAAENTK